MSPPYLCPLWIFPYISTSMPAPLRKKSLPYILPRIHKRMHSCVKNISMPTLSSTRSGETECIYVIRMLWCMIIMFALAGLKFCDSGCNFFTVSSVLFPVSFLAFTRTISNTSASITAHCLAAFHISIITLRVAAKAHLCDILHFFIFLIQAGAGDAIPEEFDKCVHVERNFACFYKIVTSLSLFQLN